jgi:hypothetical protein
MSAQVVPLVKRFQRPHDWTQCELAEFYRVESALIQAGLELETDRGVTDEGDPWFVFCRTDNGDVFIHFARIDGQYVAVGAALEQVVEGKDFPALVQEMLTTQAWVMAKSRNTSNVFLHPSALLIALVGAAFFHSGDAKAAEVADHARPDLRRHTLPFLIHDMRVKLAPALDTTETAAILSGVLLGLGGFNTFTPPGPGDPHIGPAEIPVHSIDLAPPPTLMSPAPQIANILGAPVASQTQPEPASQQLSANPHFGLESTTPSTSYFPVDQPGVGPATLGGVAGGVVHLDFSTPVAVNSAGLLQASATDAAEVVQSSNILSYLVTQPALAPEAAPAALTSLINQGEHVASTTSHPPPSSTNDASDGSSSGAASPAPSEPASPSLEFSPSITTVVAAFAAEVSVLDVVFSGQEIIIYDGAILKALPAGTQLDSVTFNFGDGSSVSLVGTATELHNLHLPG